MPDVGTVHGARQLRRYGALERRYEIFHCQNPSEEASRLRGRLTRRLQQLEALHRPLGKKGERGSSESSFELKGGFKYPLQ